MRTIFKTFRGKTLALSTWLFFVLIGCASNDPYMMPVGDENNRAPGAAYTADGMHFRKPIPHRPNPHPWQFYYKHCEKTSQADHISKTSYSCNEPF